MTKIPVYRGNLPAAMGLDYEFSRILTESGEAKAPNYHKPYKDYANIPEREYDSLRWKAIDKTVERLANCAYAGIDLIAGVNLIDECKDAYCNNLDEGWHPRMIINVEAIGFRRRTNK